MSGDFEVGFLADAAATQRLQVLLPLNKRANQQ
jgi:hypothetical protein